MGDGDPDSGMRLGQDAEADSTLVVMSAASLVEILPQLSTRWEVSGTRVVMPVFDATSRLARQLEAGAPADVFLAADRDWMAWAVEMGLVDGASVRVFAANSLVMIVPAGEGRSVVAAGLVSGEEVPAALRRLMLAGEEVPAGRYAEGALAAAGLWNRVSDRVVRGGSVRQVLEWVARDEADAGVVYRTDAVGDDRVTISVELPSPAGDDVLYFAGAVRAGDVGAAARFITHLSTPESVGALEAAGFVRPAPGWGALSPDLTATRVAQIGTPTDPSTGLGAVIRLSLIVAFLATLVGLPPALLLGRILARHEFPGKTVLLAVVLIPLVLPPVVTGYLLLGVFGRNAPMGRLLEAVGIDVAFAPAGAVIAAAVVGFPLLVLAIRSAFEATDPGLEELAWTLGDRPRRSFFRVAIPLALPGIAAGMVLAFARALGEFGATIVLAGNVAGRTRTIPLAVYSLLEAPEGGAGVRALVWASIILSLCALAGYEILLRRRPNGVRRAQRGGMP